MTNYKLNMPERLGVMGLLPKETNYVTLKILNNVRKKLAPSEEEKKEYEIKLNPDGTLKSWNPEKAVKETTIEIGETGVEFVKEALRKLSDENKLTNQHLSLYEKFIDSAPEEKKEE
jgi:hypothetical protein